MKDLHLYHGTSSKAFELIKKNGFVFGEPRHHSWHGTLGLYLAPNRPLVARRFAKVTANLDFSDPVVLKVTIKEPESNRILDLTTDTGMNRLYKAYMKTRSLFSLPKSEKLGSNTPKDYREYKESIRSTYGETLKKLEEASNAWKEDPLKFNWDTYAIQSIVTEDGIQLVKTATQEGSTFGALYFHHEPYLKCSPNYRGIRERDHIEVSIYDLGLIEKNSISVRSFDEDKNEFDEDFINYVTDTVRHDIDSYNKK